MKLQGKTAIVSGASQGIGKALAIELAREGANVVLAARTFPKLEAAAEEIRALGVKALPVACDTNNTADILHVVDEAIKTFGDVEILANLAQGAMAYRELKDCDEEWLHLAYNTGTLASFTFMKACFPYMKEAGGGKIINCCSAAGMGAVGFGAYAIAKEGIRALTRSAAKEWGPYHINVNCFMPLAKGEGWGDAGIQAADLEAMVTATVPLGYMALPEEVAKNALFLALPESDYITGMTLAVDGGQYMIV